MNLTEIVALFAVGWVVWRLVYKPYREGLHGPKAPSKQKSKLRFNNESKAKGDTFEKFVVKKFDRGFFTVLEWRGDKEVDGQYALSNLKPDLEVRFRLRDFTTTFAVECKYRQYFTRDTLTVAGSEQLNRYRNFQSENAIPVYVALGVDGSPSFPEEFYLIPLNFIKQPEILKSDIQKFRGKVENKFFYNIDLNRLTC